MKLLGGWVIVDHLGRVRFPYEALCLGSMRAQRPRSGPRLDWASAPLAAEIMRVRVPSTPRSVHARMVKWETQLVESQPRLERNEGSTPSPCTIGQPRAHARGSLTDQGAVVQREDSGFALHQ